MDVPRGQRLGVHPGRVFVNGFEVTDECIAFDDREGYALVLFQTPRLAIPINRSNGAPMYSRLYGSIEFWPNEVRPTRA
jgi:hypothetical protein